MSQPDNAQSTSSNAPLDNQNTLTEANADQIVKEMVAMLDSMQGVDKKTQEKTRDFFIHPNGLKRDLNTFSLGKRMQIGIGLKKIALENKPQDELHATVKQTVQVKALTIAIRVMEGANTQNSEDKRNINKIAEGGDAIMTASATRRKKAAGDIFKLLR